MQGERKRTGGKKRRGNSRGRRNRRSVGKKVEQREDKKTEEGLGGKESACQRGGPGSDPWPGEVPPAKEQLAREPQL